jgi:hypothetical protein
MPQGSLDCLPSFLLLRHEVSEFGFFCKIHVAVANGVCEVGLFFLVGLKLFTQFSDVFVEVRNQRRVTLKSRPLPVNALFDFSHALLEAKQGPGKARDGARKRSANFFDEVPYVHDFFRTSDAVRAGRLEGSPNLNEPAFSENGKALALRKPQEGEGHVVIGFG